MCFLWGANLWLRPSWWMSTVQDPRNTSLATGALLAVWWRIPSLGQRLPLPGSGCGPPASLPPAGYGLVCSWLALLWYLLSPLFCEQAQQCHRLELFTGKFSLSLFSLSDYPTVWVAISGQLPQIVLGAFMPSPYPKQCSPCLPVQPPLAGGRREHLGYFSAGSCS